MIGVRAQARPRIADLIREEKLAGVTNVSTRVRPFCSRSLRVHLHVDVCVSSHVPARINRDQLSDALFVGQLHPRKNLVLSIEPRPRGGCGGSPPLRPKPSGGGGPVGGPPITPIRGGASPGIGGPPPPAAVKPEYTPEALPCQNADGRIFNRFASPSVKNNNSQP